MRRSLVLAAALTAVLAAPAEAQSTGGAQQAFHDVEHVQGEGARRAVRAAVAQRQRQVEHLRRRHRHPLAVRPQQSLHDVEHVEAERAGCPVRAVVPQRQREVDDAVPAA